VRAIKIVGRQRRPAYVALVPGVGRGALARVLRAADSFAVQPAWIAELDKLSEGRSHTLGAYYRPWK
jgi:putative protease